MRSHDSDPGRLYLTEQHLTSVRTHLERTGVSVRALLKMHKKETQGITNKMVYDWLTGRIKSADSKHYQVLIGLLETTPDWEAEHVKVSEEILKMLKEEQHRSGVSPQALMQRIDYIPEGLTVYHIENVMRGLTKTTRRTYMELLISEWKKQPDAPARVPITSDLARHMMKEKGRTGIGPMALLWNTKEIRPSGLTTSLMDAWLSRRTRSARKDHIDFVLERWRKMPNAVTDNAATGKS